MDSLNYGNAAQVFTFHCVVSLHAHTASWWSYQNWNRMHVRKYRIWMWKIISGIMQIVVPVITVLFNCICLTIYCFLTVFGHFQISKSYYEGYRSITELALSKVKCIFNSSELICLWRGNLLSEFIWIFKNEFEQNSIFSFRELGKFHSNDCLIPAEKKAPVMFYWMQLKKI